MGPFRLEGWEWEWGYAGARVGVRLGWCCFEGKVRWSFGVGPNDFECRYGDVWLVVIVDGHTTYWISLNPGLRLHTPLIPYRDQTLSPS